MTNEVESFQKSPARRRTSEETEALVIHAMDASSRPLSAYDIAEMTCQAGSSLNANQVYRTLGRLIDRGKVRRIETLNAYMCCNGEVDACMICDDCHRVRLLDVPDLRGMIGKIAKRENFIPDRHIIEILGQCADCQPAGKERQ
ncbi:MAG: Fur family transcriptional regulator [Sphingomonadaceae bacterium]